MHLPRALSISVLLTAVTSAARIPRPLQASTAAPANSDVFGLMALRSASPIHFGTIQANDGAFWIGKASSTTCPRAFNGTCMNGTSTVFTAPDEYGGLGLDVLVAGGQKVYIDAACGAVRYTRPHGDLPMGANATGWDLRSSGLYFEYLSWVGGTVFCPTGNGTTGTSFGDGPWQMYAMMDGVVLPKNGSGCLGASLLTLPWNGPGAWAYR